MRTIKGLLLAVIVSCSLGGCTALGGGGQGAKFNINESAPDLEPFRLPLVEVASGKSVMEASGIMNANVGHIRPIRAAFWTLVSVEPFALPLPSVVVADTIITPEWSYDNYGNSKQDWWGSLKAFSPGSNSSGKGFIPEKKLRGKTGTRMYAIENRAFGVMLDNDKGHFFAVKEIGDLRARRRSTKEVPLTPENGIWFSYKIDKKGNVLPQLVGTPEGTTNDTIALWGQLLGNLKLRYIGTNKEGSDRFQTVHEGTFYVHNLTGSGVITGTHPKISDYKAQMIAYAHEKEKLQGYVARYDTQVALKKKRAAKNAALEVERKAAERQTIVKRQEAEKNRIAYLKTPQGKAYLAEKKARQKVEDDTVRNYANAMAMVLEQVRNPACNAVAGHIRNAATINAPANFRMMQIDNIAGMAPASCLQ